MSAAAQTGELTLPIGGVNRTLAFNMGALMLFADAYPGGLQAGFDALAESKLTAIAAFTYHALNQRHRVNALPKDFDEQLAADWVGELLFTQKDEFEKLATALVESIAALGNRMGVTPPAATPPPPSPAATSKSSR